MYNMCLLYNLLLNKNYHEQVIANFWIFDILQNFI